MLHGHTLGWTSLFISFLKRELLPPVYPNCLKNILLCIIPRFRCRFSVLYIISLKDIVKDRLWITKLIDLSFKNLSPILSDNGRSRALLDKLWLISLFLLSLVKQGYNRSSNRYSVPVNLQNATTRYKNHFLF